MYLYNATNNYFHYLLIVFLINHFRMDIKWRKAKRQTFKELEKAHFCLRRKSNDNPIIKIDDVIILSLIAALLVVL